MSSKAVISYPVLSKKRIGLDTSTCKMLLKMCVKNFSVYTTDFGNIITCESYRGKTAPVELFVAPKTISFLWVDGESDKAKPIGVSILGYDNMVFELIKLTKSNYVVSSCGVVTNG